MAGPPAQKTRWGPVGLFEVLRARLEQRLVLVAGDIPGDQRAAALQMAMDYDEIAHRLREAMRG